jgi:hypothetical protein
MYHFYDDADLLVLSLPKLRKWFFKNQVKYTERKQGKWEQSNDTCGHPVPIKHLEKEELIVKRVDVSRFTT